MRLSSFQRLALATTITTYVLILVGGLVRASGAGLGCPDWPRCFGSWIPPASAEELPPQFDVSQFNPMLMWTEYANRLLGVTVGILVSATAVIAWRRHRRDVRILWPTVAAFLLTGFQGWLGGRVVAHELAAWIVTAHMLVALIIVSLLLYATFHALSGRVTTSPPAGRQMSFLVLLWLLIAVSLAQVVLGTQVRGAVDLALDAGTARATALAGAGVLDRLHRDGALVVTVMALVAVLMATTRAPFVPLALRWSYAVVALVVAQGVLGIVLAYVSLPPVAQVAHLTVASLLLGAETVLVLVVRNRWSSGESRDA